MITRLTYDKSALDAFCKRWKVAELALFGSVLRTDFRPDSDVDVAIVFLDDSHWNLLDIVTMKEELKEIFGRNVDIVEKDAVRNPFFRRSMLLSSEVVYAG